MTIVDPQLSPQGWGTSNRQVIDNTFARFFVLDASRSNTFLGKITSMSELCAKYGNDPQAMCEETKVALEILFRNIAEMVVATVEDIPFKPTNDPNAGRYGLKITVETLLNGERRNLFRELAIGDSTFTIVKEYLNDAV